MTKKELESLVLQLKRTLAKQAEQIKVLQERQHRLYYTAAPGYTRKVM